MFERPEWWVSQLLFGWLPSLVWLAVIGATAWVLAKLALDRAVPQVSAPPELSAVEQLRVRYVRGEIDVETFREMLSHLSPAERLTPSEPP